MSKLQELADALRVEAEQLEFLAGLDESQLQQVLEGLHAAADQQHRQIDAAVREALNHIPRMLRGPVKKMLFRNA